MSVIQITKKELEQARDNVKWLAKYGESDGGKQVYSAVVHSKAYLLKYHWYKTAMPDENLDELVDHIIDRLFWYVQVGNKLAEALQYQREPKLFEEAITGEDEGEKSPTSLWDLRKALSGIHYNLYTNDGHIFLSEEWLKLYEAIQQAIDNKLLYGVEDEKRRQAQAGKDQMRRIP